MPPHEPFWRIDPDLVAEVIHTAGINPRQGPDHIVERLRAWMLLGSTAKLAALAAGEVPPGDDPAGIIRTRLENPGLSWSCWAASTVTAAILDSCGYPVRLAVAQEVGDDHPPVDFHASLAFDDGSLVDPYHGPAVATPTGGSATDGYVTCTVATGDGGLIDTYTIRRQAGRPLLYKIFARDADLALVRAFLTVSATHSGVAGRPGFTHHGDTHVTRATTDENGESRRSIWRRRPGGVELVREDRGDYGEFLEEIVTRNGW